MLNEEREKTALARFTVIAPLLARGDPRPLQERLAELAAREWPQPDGSLRQHAPSTIEGWYYAYRAKGLETLQNRERADKGRERCIAPELAGAIGRLIVEHPRLRTRHVIRHLRETGDLKSGGPSASSLYRYIAKHRPALCTPLPARERRAFETSHPGSLWQADIMYGPYVPVRGPDGRLRKRQTYLLDIIDDHSRLCVHGRFYLSQGLDALCDALEEAVRKRGIPERLYVDNGLVFSGTQLGLICARIGTRRIRTKKGDAAAKGKVERFHKTVRMSFLNALLELHPPANLAALNTAFGRWVEEEYNGGPHTGIDGATPLERWLAGSACVRLLADDGAHDHSFLVTEDRVVRNDGTIVFAGRAFETDFALKGRTVAIRRRLAEPDRLHVYDDGRYIGIARPLNRTLNATLPRHKTSPATSGDLA